MRNGFTLIETLIVAGIALFLSGILLTYNRSTDSQVVLAAEQARVAGVLFRAKSFALQRSIREGSITPCGFGVLFESPRTMTLFQDLPPAESECSASNGSYDAGEEVEELVLNPRVEIYSFNGSPLTQASVFFRSPYLETEGTGTIALRLVGTNDARTVVVGEGGSISTGGGGPYGSQ